MTSAVALLCIWRSNGTSIADLYNADQVVEAVQADGEAPKLTFVAHEENEYTNELRMMCKLVSKSSKL